jgi:hypothetical protein
MQIVIRTNCLSFAMIVKNGDPRDKQPGVDTTVCPYLRIPGCLPIFPCK